MRARPLTDLFRGVAWKRLTAHEVDPSVSHGHEFQGVARLRSLLGDAPRDFKVKYMMPQADGNTWDILDSTAKWYDSRERNPARAAEWRLYYPADAGALQARAHAGDLMVIALIDTDNLAVFIAPRDTEAEVRIALLFGIPLELAGATQARALGLNDKVDFLASQVLEELGFTAPPPELEQEETTAFELASMLQRDYPQRLPTGYEVSKLIQSTVSSIDCRDDPDAALIQWVETEDAVFRLWEDALIERRLRDGFMMDDGKVDVVEFRRFMMSLRQSRVSRAGSALQHHVKRVLDENNVRFASQAAVDQGEIPDFLFPGIAEYNDPLYDANRLRILAVKFTVKDRWRQVLNEAHRVTPKHLLTLDVGISQPQLRLMHDSGLQPVVPRLYADRYPAASQTHLMSFQAFIVEVMGLEARQSMT